MQLLKVCLLLSLLCSSLLAATIRVPQDQPTIQAGINAAVNGDTVLVSPGDYMENLNISSRSIAVISKAGCDSTNLQPAVQGQDLLIIQLEEGQSLLIRGFSFSSTIGGNCIEAHSSGILTIQDNTFEDNQPPIGDNSGSVLIFGTCHVIGNIFQNNSGGTHGSGLRLDGSGSGIVEGNIFRNNSATYGAAINLLHRSQAILRYNLLIDNSASSYGGGIYVANASGILTHNNTIVHCSSGNNGGGGICLGGSTNDSSFNNIIIDCVGYGIWGANSPATLADYNDVFNNAPSNYYIVSQGSHNFSADPIFVAGNPFDFHIQAGSPCVDAGSPEPRFEDPNGSRNDVGAFTLIPPDTKKEVPREYLTIQSAIDAAVDGDTVLIHSGTYQGPGNTLVTTEGKKIVIVGEESDSEVIIDAEMAQYAFIFDNDEDSLTILKNITISGAHNGAQIAFASPRFVDVHFAENRGNGIFFVGYSSSIVRGCVFEENDSSGIATQFGSSWMKIDESTFRMNHVAGVMCPNEWADGTLKISKCNFDSTGVGIRYYGEMAYVDSCTFVENTLAANGSFTMRDCVIHSGVDGLATRYSSPFGGGNELHVKRCTLSDLQGTAVRIGLFVQLDSVQIKNCAGAVISGQGYSSEFYHSLVLNDCRITDNNGSFTLGDYVNLVMNRCVYARNHHGIVYQNIPYQLTEQFIRISNSLIVDNASDGVNILRLWGNQSYITNTIIASNSGFGIAIHGTDLQSFTMSCDDFFGNSTGAFGELPAEVDSQGIIFADPKFCKGSSDDYTIRDISPCAPAHSPCGSLIGTFGVSCYNVAPIVTSNAFASAISGVYFKYEAAALDPDGPLVAFSFMNRPAWLVASGDSVSGYPPLTDPESSFVVVATDGYLADSLLVLVSITESPVVSHIRIEDFAEPNHVLSAYPLISWSYFDATAVYPQTQYEIAVGSDSNWSYAELWNPAPFAGADSLIVYSGAALLDGHTYWLRARLRNDLLWSNWKQTMFHLNSLPTVPTPLLPVGDIAVSSTQPVFVIRNSSDGENDSLRYIFEISSDSTMIGAHVFEKTADADSITSAQVDIVLDENTRYFWRVKASDYYEQSGYSAIGSFWVNSANSAPSAFDLASPPNTMTPPLATKSPTLDWTTAGDLDPLDHVTYTLHLAIDSNFAFVNQIPGLDSSRYTPPTPLEWGTRYWWKVRALDLHGGETWSSQVYRFRIMMPGDANGNGSVSISDVVFLINYIFAGGAAPSPLSAGDANCSGAISISDAVYLINYIFAGGAAPCQT